MIWIATESHLWKIRLIAIESAAPNNWPHERRNPLCTRAPAVKKYNNHECSSGMTQVYHTWKLDSRWNKRDQRNLSIHNNVGYRRTMEPRVQIELTVKTKVWWADLPLKAITTSFRWSSRAMKHCMSVKGLKIWLAQCSEIRSCQIRERDQPPWQGGFH